MRRGIVPVHQQRLIARIEIVRDQSSGIGLLVDKSYRGGHAQQAAIDVVADSEIGRHKLGRAVMGLHKWAAAEAELPLFPAAELFAR
jgi:hypothetical protein